MEMHPVYLAMDPYLIRLYRITGCSFADFLLGTFVVAFVALFVGEVTASLAFLAAKKSIDRTTKDVIRYRNLSMEALAAGDKDAYEAANKLANDAFGQSFFKQIALSSAFLWPLFLALGWLNARFSGVEFTFVTAPYTVGVGCIFITLYVASYLLFRRIKYRLPHFRRIKTMLDAYDARSVEVKKLSDVFPLPDSAVQRTA